jgi:hypothetical protein
MHLIREGDYAGQVVVHPEPPEFRTEDQEFAAGCMSGRSGPKGGRAGG